VCPACLLQPAMMEQSPEKETPVSSPVEKRRGRRPEDNRLLGELQALRCEVQRQRARCVAPYPFTGRRMHFRDDAGSSLRLLGDGRFQYEQRQILSAGRQIITTIEGVLAGAVPGAEGDFTTAVYVDADSNVARIELQAMLRSETEELKGGSQGGSVVRPRSVTSVDGRLKLTIGPFFAVEYAEVEPLGHLSSKHGAWPPRLVRLPCVFADALCGTGSSGTLTSTTSASPQKPRATGICGGTALDWCKGRSKALANTRCFGSRCGGLNANVTGSPPPRGFRRMGASASAPDLVCSLASLGSSVGGSTSTIQARTAKAMFRPGPNLRPPAADRALLQPDFHYMDTGSGPISKLTKQGQLVPRLLLDDHKFSTSNASSLLGTVTTDFGGAVPPPAPVPQTDWKEYYKNRAAKMLGGT
jgi:hypothetical protein